MNERLRPCPFCGAKEDKVELWDDETDVVWKHAYQVMCIECGVRTYFFRTKDEAVNSWNRRISHE